jgi:hypothetical protein
MIGHVPPHKKLKELHKSKTVNKNYKGSIILPVASPQEEADKKTGHISHERYGGIPTHLYFKRENFYYKAPRLRTPAN